MTYFCFKCHQEPIRLGEILCHLCRGEVSLSEEQAINQVQRYARECQPTRAEKAVDAAWERGTG
jgi:hypothetical protein